MGYYSAEEDRVRIVSIVPTERWGGEGVLGAEVGHGYLHRLPSACRGTTGASVGFVTLPKDATAATDAYSALIWLLLQTFRVGAMLTNAFTMFLVVCLCSQASVR